MNNIFLYAVISYEEINEGQVIDFHVEYPKSDSQIKYVPEVLKSLGYRYVDHSLIWINEKID